MFRFDGKYDEQVRGLAMGNRLAPLLSICCMANIERNDASSDILLYKRYIDIFIMSSSKESIDTVFQKLHTGNIKLSREPVNQEGWLAILNLELRFKEGNIRI